MDGTRKPRVGEDIYVPGELNENKRNDFSGGLCRIVGRQEKRIRGKGKTILIEVKERPGYKYELSDLTRDGRQEKLRGAFGAKRGKQYPISSAPYKRAREEYEVRRHEEIVRHSGLSDGERLAVDYIDLLKSFYRG